MRTWTLSPFGLAAAIVLLGVQSPPSTVLPAQGALRGADPPDGITVRASGSANATATRATLSLHVTTRNNALTLDQSALAPIVDAMVRAGVDRSAITLPIYLTNGVRTNNATITASIDHPSQQMIQRGIAQMSGSLPNDSSILLTSAEVRLTADDCAPAMEQAQAVALRQARVNAQNVARQINARLGGVLAVDVQSMALDAQGRCISSYGIGPYQVAAEPPADYLTVHVFASVTVRYAIR